MSFVEKFMSLSENNAVFSLGYVQELKKKLENLEGQQLQIVQNSKQLQIRCVNKPIRSCPFVYRFDKKKDEESKEIGLQLKHRFILHSQVCNFNDEQAHFEWNSNLIQTHKLLIANLMFSRYSLYGSESPKKLLQVFSEQMQFSGPFIYQGVVSQDLKRKIKKKFDNLISEIRINLKIPASYNPMKKCKRKSQKRKAKFSIKPFYHSGQNDKNDVEAFFASEESKDYEESLFQPKINRQIQAKNLRQLRNHQTTLKQRQNPEQSSFESIENDPITVLSHETFQPKTKIIKKQ